MIQPILSIIIANYNYGRFLGDAIRSVMSQGMGDKVEIIICDAGSSDDSVEVIKKFAGGLQPNTVRPTADLSDETPITWWCSEPDGGQSAAFNKGFARARGRFLTWLNADDAFMPGALKAVERAIARNPRAEWFAGSSVWCDASMNIERCFCAHRFSDLRAAGGSLMVGGPSSFFTKRLLDEVGGVDESLHYVMDIDLWYKFYRQCNARYVRIKDLVWAFRQHEDSKMSGADCATTEKALANRKKAHLESELINARHNRKTGWRRRLAELLTVSPIDILRAKRYDRQYLGKNIFEL